MKGLKTVVCSIAAGLAILWFIKGVFRVFEIGELIEIVVFLSMLAGITIHMREAAEIRILSEAEKAKAEHKSAIEEMRLRAEQKEHEDQRRFSKIVETMDRFHDEFKKEASVWEE